MERELKMRKVVRNMKKTKEFVGNASHDLQMQGDRWTSPKKNKEMVLTGAKKNIPVLERFGHET